ncbi:hypothetical protein CHS0354_017508 [Potamilus streckersoni]|uniref:Uncharacterized protein n=1 Tax=Potamilus streckersoni TaxID=2493646 RepID=A0AAE0VN33_9BIVA|nr:hypothetical protein CHS0354_017508 [Potamilus streckersoni]
MALLGKTDVGFRQIGGKVTVPNDARAKLMYYLNCMCTVVDLDDTAPNLQRLRDFQNYYLTLDDLERLITMCLFLPPEIFINNCIFQEDALCGDSNNKFYEITQVKHRFLVSGNVVIGGQNRQVNKIMAFKLAWLNNNYYIPLQTLLQQRQMRRQNATMLCTVS